MERISWCVCGAMGSMTVWEATLVCWLPDSRSVNRCWAGQLWGPADAPLLWRAWGREVSLIFCLILSSHENSTLVLIVLNLPPKVHKSSKVIFKHPASSRWNWCVLCCCVVLNCTPLLWLVDNSNSSSNHRVFKKQVAIWSNSTWFNFTTKTYRYLLLSLHYQAFIIN